MQRWQCPICNGTFKALSNQVWIRYPCFCFFKLFILICDFSSKVKRAFLGWKIQLLELNIFWIIFAIFACRVTWNLVLEKLKQTSASQNLKTFFKCLQRIFKTFTAEFSNIYPLFSIYKKIYSCTKQKHKIWKFHCRNWQTNIEHIDNSFCL